MSTQTENSSVEVHMPTKKRSVIDHASNVLNKFLDFYEKEEFCDTVLITKVDKIKIQAHKSILSASSEYFRALFRNTWRESSSSDDVKLEEIEGETLKSVISFMYTGTIELCNETVELVAKAANFFQIDSLISICCDFMAENIEISNCFSISCFAEHFNLTALAEKALKFTCKNFEKMSVEKEFLELNEEQLCGFICRDDICVESEEKLFHIVVSWIDHDKENRGDSLLNLLKQIRFTSLTPKFIIDNIECNTPECYKLIHSWIKWHISPEKRLELRLEQTKPRNSPQKLVIVAHLTSYNISLRIYDPDLKTWSTTILPSPTTENLNITVRVSNNNKLFIPGGFESQSIECFDFETNLWSDIPQMRIERNLCRFVELNGNLYVYGGIGSARRHLNSLDKFNNNSHTWEAMANLNTSDHRIVNKPHFHWVSVLNSMLYTIGADSNMYCYNPLANEWTEKRFPENKTILAAVNGNLYAFGGRCNTVFRYSPLADIWNASGSLDLSGICLGCTSYKKHLIVCSRTSDEFSIIDYNPETDEKKNIDAPLLDAGVKIALFTLNN